MPSKNVIRKYEENGYYHIYNRGVEKRVIFEEESDYRIFQYYIFVYLASPDKVRQNYPSLKFNLARNNLYSEVSLISYCLMPNHFHFLIKQITKDGITKFMRRMIDAYTRYFNQKYERVGSLLQGKFKASKIENDEYLLYLTAYIHQNPLKFAFKSNQLVNYFWSSYSSYIGGQKKDFVNPEEILLFFSKTNPKLTYKSFVEGSTDLSQIVPEDILFDDID